MTPQDLADEVERVVGLCTDRITGIGAQQYHVEGQPQKFETMDFDALAEYYEEELRDIINYAVMTHIRLGRLRRSIKAQMNGRDLYDIGFRDGYDSATTPQKCYDDDGSTVPCHQEKLQVVDRSWDPTLLEPNPS